MTDIEASYTGDNYTTNLSIYTELGEDEKIKVTVSGQDGSEQIFILDANTGFSRLTFATKSVGLNTILIQKLNAKDEELSSKTIYKVLPYSKEYLAYRDTEAAEKLMTMLSADTDGVVVEEPAQIFENAVEYLHIVIDPRLLFTIIIIVCFLIDIAVRKFKWKWPHEIIRDKRLKSRMSNK